MSILDELTEKYYQKFVSLPTGNPIVRQNQKNDAFELVVLETLYGAEKEIDIEKYSSSDIGKITKYIVPPPDEGIDIIIQHEDIDSCSYDFVQVKNSELTPVELQKEIHYMEDSISKYLSNPKKINDNLKTVLSSTDFSKDDKNNCRFLLVHRGTTNYFKDQKENEQIITGTELEIIRNSADKTIPKVPYEELSSDSFTNFIEYDKSSSEPAIIFNLCGYDLANLALKYTNTTLGRNILFGQNLRESLTKSKTYDGMANTIRNEPERFWFYNNGVTIIVEDYDAKRKTGNEVDSVILKNFSIINGAQTTSALGRFLKEAILNNDQKDIEKLKNVFVLARVLKVNDHEFGSRIAIYNNTQNPITTRDMASNREEQLQLSNGLLKQSPHIYIEIRRGLHAPADIKFYKHQMTTNEEIAQLSFAGFMKDPFTAKDKKTSLFDIDYKQTEYLVNEYYHKIFNNDQFNDKGLGVLFTKKPEEIDEILFIHYLYKESKKNLIKIYKERIKKAEAKGNLEDIQDYERIIAISNICVFYCIDYYFSLRDSYSDSDIKVFKYDSFYNDKNEQLKLIEAFRDLFLMGTIKIIKDLTVSSPNLNTWVRDKKSTDLFNKKVKDTIQLELSLEKSFDDFMKTY